MLAVGGSYMGVTSNDAPPAPDLSKKFAGLLLPAWHSALDIPNLFIKTLFVRCGSSRIAGSEYVRL